MYKAGTVEILREGTNIDKLRIVEILRAGIYYNSDFEEMEKGDIFHMYESDGTMVLSKDNWCDFIVVSDVRKSEKNGVLEVDVKGIYGSPEGLGIYEEF